ncbi:RTA1 like protein-domain-containing protein [Flagelloscypha sp. PMI_526]|nr:RTA1 like protein-domain-containing protein [Flagelloscypha sp. PMI_526]
MAEFLSSPYGYIPTSWITILFVALFGLSAVLHGFLGLWYRKWFLLVAFTLCSTAEVLGWVARMWSSYDVLNVIPFQIQITCTIVAPTFTLAGLFATLGQMIRQLGHQFAWFSPRFYLIAFIAADVIALVVQAVGGATASSGIEGDTKKQDLGANIMLGGIAFQLSVLVLAIIVGLVYFFRYFHKKPVRKLPNEDGNSNKQVASDEKVGASVWTMIAVLAISIYRTIELTDGWEGRIIQTQVYFNVLDGTMIVLVQYLLLFFHPGRLLDTEKGAAKSEEDGIHLRQVAGH